MRLTGTMLLIVLTVSCAAQGADWPQFLGPTRDGISSETGLATTWPAEGPKPLWTVPLGPGFGGAAVSNGKVYLMDRVGDQSDVLRCVDLAKGNKLWDFQFEAPGKVDKPGSRSTPTVDGKNIYIVGIMGDIYCINADTHEKVWNRNLKEFGTGRPTWAITQSAVVYKDMVIVAPQSDTAGVVALDKKTGKDIWASAAIGKIGYCSPQIVRFDGMDQVVMLTTDTCAGIDPKDGKVLWEYKGWKCGIPVPDPTVIGDGRLFITAAYNAGCAMIKVSREGDAWKVTQLQKNRNCESHIHHALLYQNHLYANSDSDQGNNKGVICMDLDTKVLWAQKGLTNKGGSLILADGMIYLMNGTNGTLYLIKPDPEGFKQLAQAKVLEGTEGSVWAPLVLSDGKLLCRDQKEMKCLDVRGK